MAVNWAMWEAIGTIGATIAALFLGLYPLIKEFRGKPRIVIERTDSDIFDNPRNNVAVYYLRITNKGNTTALQVKIRALEVKQGDTHFISPHDRYHVFSSDSIQNGDYISTNFINNHKDEEWFMTPAGRDRKFLRKKTQFTLLISGDNFHSYRKKITVEPIGDSKDLSISL